MNNVKDSIGWCDYTLNPVTGCKRGCSFCYARRIHERFSKTPFSDIVFHPQRLNEKMPKTPSRIFVGSMSDIEYWDRDVVHKILAQCSWYDSHTFMFLSKSPYAYSGYVWPANTMQGLTLTCDQHSDTQYLYVSKMAALPRPFLSIEPILGPLGLSLHNASVELVIVGAMTGPGAVAPKQEWIDSIKRNVPAEKLYWKRNIKRYL